MEEITKPLLDMVRGHYRSPAEIRKYAGRADGGLLEWERAVCEHYFEPPQDILNIGCGAGREAFALSDRGYRVTGTDISLEQLAEAERNAAKWNKPVSFSLSDGLWLDFRDESYDHVIAWSQVLGNVPGEAGRATFVSEAARVLRLGGTFSCSAHNREVCEPKAAGIGIVESMTGVSLEDGDLITRDGEAGLCYWHYFVREELLALCSHTGLSVLKCGLASEFGQSDWDTVWVVVCRKGA